MAWQKSGDLRPDVTTQQAEIPMDSFPDILKEEKEIDEVNRVTQSKKKAIIMFVLTFVFNR